MTGWPASRRAVRRMGWPALFCLLAELAAAQAPPAPCQVHVSTIPPGAVIYCNGRIRNVAPLTLSDLEPGEHLLVATKQGYTEARTTLNLKPADKVAVELKLDAQTGLVLVHSTPPGAAVEIDGADRGRTPALLTDLPFGTYRVRLSAAGYVPKELELKVEDRTPMKIAAQLTSDSATLALNSTPAGARVSLNGIYRGNTPCTIDRIPEGPCTVALALDGYQPHQQEIKLQAGQQETLAIELAPLPATLGVVSMPPGARIYIDNQFRGNAPVTFADLKPGVYRIRAELDAHEPLARTIELAQAANVVEEFRLVVDAGSMEVVTEPAGVKVFVDGKLAGVTEARQTDLVSEPLLVPLLAPGPHEVEVTKPGFYKQVINVAIERDRTVTQTVRLQRRFIPNCEIRTAADVFQGVLLQVDPAGNVRLEVMPGVVKSIPAEEIRSRRPLRVLEPQDE